ncbi:MAG: hypothetical protein LBF75_03080 [Treponema sp.]|nr:hypothetical protein [Treponema sp.]
MAFLLQGQPKETRYGIIRNEKAVIPPFRYIHVLVGTGSCPLIWSVSGENQSFDDRATY